MVKSTVLPLKDLSMLPDFLESTGILKKALSQSPPYLFLFHQFTESTLYHEENQTKRLTVIKAPSPQPHPAPTYQGCAGRSFFQRGGAGRGGARMKIRGAVRGGAGQKSA